MSDIGEEALAEFRMWEIRGLVIGKERVGIFWEFGWKSDGCGYCRDIT